MARKVEANKYSFVSSQPYQTNSPYLRVFSLNISEILSLSTYGHTPVNYVRSISFLTLSTRKFSRHFEITNRDPRAERAPNVASDAFLFSPFPSSPSGSSISAKRTFMDIEFSFFFLLCFVSCVSLFQLDRSSFIDSK